MNFRDYIKNTRIVGLSPMDGLTNEPFRLTQCHISKPDVIFTEFVSAEGIAHSGFKIFDHLLYSVVERPIVAQLFGKDPDSFYTAAAILCHLGFDGIDINFGCPAKNVTQHGSGAALIEKPKLASEIIKAVQAAVKDYSKSSKIPPNLKHKDKLLSIINRNLKHTGSSLIKEGLGSRLVPTISVKTRLGISESTIATWIPFLLNHQPDFITLHGRTLKQGYSGIADWSEIKKAADMAGSTQTLLWGNGDIISRQQANDYCQKFNVHGVLIGRRAVGNPWVFTDHQPTWSEKFQAMIFHTREYQRIFPEYKIDALRRHYLTYLTGHPHAKELRSLVVKLTQIDDLLALEDKIINC